MKLSEASVEARDHIRRQAADVLERFPNQMTDSESVAVGDSIFDTRGGARDITVLHDFLESLEGKTMYVGMVRADRTGCRWQMVEPGEWLCVDREVG